MNAGVDEGDELAGRLAAWLVRRGYGNEMLRDLETTPPRSFVTVSGLELEEAEGATPRDWLLAIIEADEPRGVILPRSSGPARPRSPRR